MCVCECEWMMSVWTPHRVGQLEEEVAVMRARHSQDRQLLQRSIETYIQYTCTSIQYSVMRTIYIHLYSV